ncbi:hypothetical protein GW17_00046568 [Ensete ventricosum]|nr:hypothetical protein GW17_00046568 [Ensete ventricosum]
MARFSLPSGKASYRLIRTCPATDWYVDQPLPGGTTKIDRRRLIEEEKGKKKTRKRRKKKKRSTSCRPRLRVAHGSPASRRRPRRLRVTFVPAWGDETSPHAGREIEVTFVPMPTKCRYTGTDR